VIGFEIITSCYFSIHILNLERPPFFHKAGVSISPVSSFDIGIS